MLSGFFDDPASTNSSLIFRTPAASTLYLLASLNPPETRTRYKTFRGQTRACGFYCVFQPDYAIRENALNPGTLHQFNLPTFAIGTRLYYTVANNNTLNAITSSTPCFYRDYPSKLTTGCSGKLLNSTQTNAATLVEMPYVVTTVFGPPGIRGSNVTIKCLQNGLYTCSASGTFRQEPTGTGAWQFQLRKNSTVMASVSFTSGPNDYYTNALAVTSQCLTNDLWSFRFVRTSGTAAARFRGDQFPGNITLVCNPQF